MPGEAAEAPLPPPRLDLSRPASGDEYQKVSSSHKAGFRIAPPYYDKGPTFMYNPTSVEDAGLRDRVIKRVLERHNLKLQKQNRPRLEEEDPSLRIQTWELYPSDKPGYSDKIYAIQEEIEEEVKKQQELLS